MEQILKDIKGYSLTREDKERVGRMEEMMLKLDWEGISGIVREVLDE